MDAVRPGRTSVVKDLGSITVVIPTLQRSTALRPLLAMLDAHPRVAEVVLIDNASIDLNERYRCVRRIDPGRNLFVNPSWNLGVAESRTRLVALCNDDVWFPPRLVDAAANALRLPVGLVGPSNTCFKNIWGETSKPRFRPVYTRPAGYGTLMFFRRESYVPIPNEMKIWFGDDWLFHQQRRRNLAFHGVDIHTEMSTTSGSPEFGPMFAHDQLAFEELLPPARQRMEHRVYEIAATAVRRARRLRAR